MDSYLIPTNKRFDLIFVVCKFTKMIHAYIQIKVLFEVNNFSYF